MAKKRLNKKVALIGSMVFVLMAVLIIGMFLYLSRDPEKFIQDGNAAVESARQATDPNQREDLYKEAERNYTKAYGLVKTDELKVEILYRAIDVYIATDKWRETVGSWAQIVRLDPKDIQARYARLKYFYLIAQANPGIVWQEVASQANEFIDIIEKTDADPELASADTEKWEVDALKQKNEKSHRLGPYLYLIRGTANLMNTQLGTVTNKEQTLRTAVEDLQKARQMQPDDVDVYMQLARAAVLKGEIEESKGVLDARQRVRNEAIDILKEGVEATNDSLQANINLLGIKHNFSLAQADSEPNQRKKLLDLEPEYLALAAKFDSKPESFAALAGFYSDSRLGPTYLDKSIEAIEKAIELDKNNVDYATVASSLYTRRFNIRGHKQDMDKSLETASRALLLPDAQETTGPRALTAKMYQIRLNSILVNNYVDLILDSERPKGESEGQPTTKWLAEAEKAARQIEQVYGSGDDPQVIEWQGMVEFGAAKLGKGDAGAAIRKLYKIYTQLKASGKSDPRLSYKLAKIFAYSTESGAVAEFLGNALQNRIDATQPQAWLDYAEILNKAGMWKSSLAYIDIFEKRCGVTDRSRLMRISAHIGAREFADAEQYLEQIPQQDPIWMAMKVAILEGKNRQIRTIVERKKQKARTSSVPQNMSGQQQSQEAVDPRSDEQLAAEMKSNLSAFIEYMGKMFEKDPNSLDSATVASVCGDAIATGNLEQAKLAVDKTLKYHPDNPTGLLYKRLLSEPEPSKVSAEKMKQFREEVLSGIPDPVNRAMSLGIFYQTNDDPNRAAEQFKKLVSISGEPELRADETTQRRAAVYLFDIALEKKDWETADKITQTAKRGNFDECSGEFFAARVALAREQYETALASIENALTQRPVFGYGYLLRSRINANLGKAAAALTDIQTAAGLNPFDKSISRELANRLYARNRTLGDNVSSSQLAEARAALDWAMALNPGDLGLMSFFAEYISETEPQRALALRQSLQENAPSLQNALLLARLASRLAVDNDDAQRKQALFAMAESALEQAKSYDPQNPAVLDSFSEYYRLTGQQEKASQVLTSAPQLLWRYYVKTGQYDAAGKVLGQSYKTNPKDTDTLKGLLFLAEKANDKEAVAKYGEELLSAEQTADNHLLVVQTCLGVGLTKEAEQKLASFRERYPQDSRGLLLTAWLSMKQGRLKEAMETINKCLEIDQTDATAWRLRGQINNMLAEYEQAISDLQQSKTLMDSAVTRLALAKTYLKTRRIEDAITELKSIAEDPQAPDEARMLLERIYINSGRKEALNDFYAKILEKMPESIYWHKRAAAFAGVSGNLAKAEQLFNMAFQKSAQQGKQDADALNGYLRALLEQGKTDKLSEEAAKYIDGELAFVAYYWMAEARMKLGDRQNAVMYCEKALNRANEDINIEAQMVNRMYSLLGQEDIERLCRKMLVQNPDSTTANWAMFTLCSIKGDYNSALEYIEKCINNTKTEQSDWIGYNTQKAATLIKAYMKTSDNNYLKDALVTYESLLEKMPNNTSILNNVAYILADNNQDLDKALEYAKRAYEAKPNDPEYIDTYALVLHKKGRNSEAVQFEQAAIQQYETQQASVPTEAYEHLGQFHEQLGELPQARSAYEQALEAGGENMQEAVKQRITAAIERLGK
ncbi:MAG: tetratricopeptide repeat protein [Planctomycetota bacterium]